tara:strand:- start:396 stop:890 length:495 start_codon:yes stop_codon:yes gene_type:complete
MQPQQGQMVQGFTDPQAAGQPTMMGGQQVIVVAQQSPAPTWMGVIMILYGLIVTIFVGFGMATEMQDGIYMVNQLVNIFVAITIGVGGFFTFQRKKMGVWMGLGALGVSTIMGIIVSMSVRDEFGGGTFGDIAGGFGIIITLACNAFCALMIAIPLMATGSNLE